VAIGVQIMKKSIVVWFPLAILWSSLAFAQSSGWTENTTTGSTLTNDKVGIGSGISTPTAPLAFGVGFGLKLGFYPVPSSLYGVGLFGDTPSGRTYVGIYSNLNYPSGSALGTI